MSSRVREQEFAGLRWLVVSGEREDAFRALGQAARSEIRKVQESLPEASALRRWVGTEAGQARLRRLADATAVQFPEQMRELRALREGAGVSHRYLLLANLRGDLGTGDGTGCTDLGWRRKRSFVAHNEDGAPVLDGTLMLLTLKIDGDVPVTVQWYPGFVPANTFTATGHGLMWGINHVQVAEPPVAAGRHFIARALQQAPTLDHALKLLRNSPCAGGFTYTIGEVATGRVAVVEAAAGRTAVVEAGPIQPLQWHTNHLRHHPVPLDAPDGPSLHADSAQEAARSLGQYEESQARGEVLARLEEPRTEPSTEWFLDTLTSAPLPRGVHRTARGTDPLMTLCTTVADLDEQKITLQAAGNPAASLPLSDYVTGRFTSPW